jgi:hypothetical protein
MIYKTGIIANQTPLSYWNYVFLTLSTRQFSQFYEKLDFPFNPPNDLREIAHDFVVTRESKLGNVLVETVSIDLLKGVSPNESYLKSYKPLFENTFFYLEKRGYAEAVYKWGNQTCNYYQNIYIEGLNALCRLLRKWAILEWSKQPITSAHPLYSSEWQHLIAKWQPIYINNLAPLELSVHASTALQKIILQHEIRRMEFEQILDIINAAEKSEWEKFALLEQIWIKNEGRFRIDLREWNMITDTLSDEEVLLLGHWALQHRNQEHYHDLKFPLPNFQTIAVKK